MLMSTNSALTEVVAVAPGKRTFSMEPSAAAIMNDKKRSGSFQCQPAKPVASAASPKATCA